MDDLRHTSEAAIARTLGKRRRPEDAEASVAAPVPAAASSSNSFLVGQLRPNAKATAAFIAEVDEDAFEDGSTRRASGASSSLMGSGSATLQAGEIQEDYDDEDDDMWEDEVKADGDEDDDDDDMWEDEVKADGGNAILQTGLDIEITISRSIFRART